MLTDRVLHFHFNETVELKSVVGGEYFCQRLEKTGND